MTDYDRLVKELLTIARSISKASTNFEKVQLCNRAAHLRAEIEKINPTRELFIVVN